MGLKQTLGKKYRHTVGKIKYIRYNQRKFNASVKVWFLGLFSKIVLDKEKISQADNLIVCAHPDDETIFFYSVMKEKTFVVCMSNCGDTKRKKEFFCAINAQNTSGIMLNCPDVKGFTWAWNSIFTKMKLKKIKKLLKPDCNIYTHAVFGESEHPHHFAVGKAVSRTFSGFSVFHTASDVSRAFDLSDEDIKRKTQIINDMYPSQIKMLNLWCPWYEEYMKRDSFLGRKAE